MAVDLNTLRKGATGAVLQYHLGSYDMYSAGNPTSGQFLRANASGLYVPHTLVAASVTDFNEAAQDAVGAMAANSSKVTLTYVDGTPSLTADIVAGSLGVADIANRTRTIDLHDFAIAVGTPDFAVRGANSRYAAWAFDGTGVFDEAITTQTIRIPQDFSSSLLVVLHWTNLGAGSGNVDWTVVAKVVNDTADLNTTSGETLTSDTIAAPAQNIHKISVHSISLSPAAGDHLRLNVARLALTNTANDTLGNDAGLLKVQLVYTADS